MLLDTLQRMSCGKIFFETQKTTQIPHMNFCQSLRLQSGRQDSNLRPSAPKALNSPSAALGFQAISNFSLSSAKFVVTNKAIFVRNLSAVRILIKFSEINKFKIIKYQIALFYFQKFLQIMRDLFF